VQLNAPSNATADPTRMALRNVPITAFLPVESALPTPSG
jgi:hypothetical protein